MADSRYADTPVVFTNRRGTYVRGRELRPNPSWSFKFTLYTVKEGDRIDLLAARRYGDSDLWYTIADANPEVVDWFRMRPGMVIRIPAVTG